ncbi:MAG TPA: undecaprenyldiphospho-muramoylpentapeptide beta-N-acetylglucosaminyltransferase [Candidatus Polarisedimenticolaceae bacterium]
MSNRPFRIVFAGGGTGGHLYPALAVADVLRARRPDLEIRFVGARRGIETRLVPAAGYPLLALPLSGLKGAGPLARVAAAASAAWGVVRCAAWMRSFRPTVVVGVGGYASGPAVVAAKLLGVKSMVMEQNHFPGATNRALAPRVDVVCVPSEAARERLGGRGIVTGNPVRAAFATIGDPPGGARTNLLVFGGSRGARTINRAVVEALPALAALHPPPRVVHQTGDDAVDAVRRAYAGQPALDGEVHAFLDDMPRRVAHADLVVCRAGATTLAELAAAGRPAILIPFPHAADDHQRHNAQAVADAGAAVVILDADANGDSIARAVAALAADPKRRSAMASAARALAKPDAAGRIADLVENLAEGGSRVP